MRTLTAKCYLGCMQKYGNKGERRVFPDNPKARRSRVDGQIYIKDTKSSNGTFVNGERLSPEGLESDPYELNSQDTVVSLFVQTQLTARNSASISSVTTIARSFIIK